MVKTLSMVMWVFVEDTPFLWQVGFLGDMPLWSVVSGFRVGLDVN